MSLRSQLGSQQRPNPAPSDSGSVFSGVSLYGAKTPSSDGSQFQQQRQGGPNSNTNIYARSDSNNNGGPGNASAGPLGAPPGGYSSKPPPPPAISPEQSRAIARTHFDALRTYLARENALNSSSQPRNNAREKLTRLTRQQFQELSTDVYDELVRRMDEAAGRGGDQPFLSTRQEFHPKRNQARQKLATLPLGRFRDLASDVYFELERRYPEFAEEEVAPANEPSPSRYSPPPPAPIPSNINNSRSANAAPLFSSSSASPTSSNSNPNFQNGAKSLVNTSISRGDRRIPTPTGSGGNPTANDVVVPNKSTMIVEEEPGPGGGAYNGNGNGNGNGGSEQQVSSPTSYQSQQQQQQKSTSPYGNRPETGGSDGYEDPSQTRNAGARASETSSIGTRFIGNYAGSAANSEAGGRRSWEYEEKEKVKSEYEYKITMLQSRMADVQRENDDMREALKSRSAETTRVRDLENQVRTHRDRYDDQSSTLQKLRSDFDALQSSRSHEGASSNGSRGDVERLTRERTEADELANELRAEVGSLVDEIRSVNARYEELLETREKEARERVELEEEARSWRKKYEQAKTELRNIKATSQLFVGSIKVEGDHMPASSDGIIADVNVTAFQTCIDELLQAARSKEPSSVLTAMRAVVGAVEKIDSDVQAADPRRLQALPLAEQDRLQTLKSKTNATLSNLMTASKNHAMSFGVSPVSLVDAAASHLSASIVDLVRLLKIRRTSGGGQLSNGGRPTISNSISPPPVPVNKSNGYLPGGGSNVSSSSDLQRDAQRGVNSRGPVSVGSSTSMRSPPLRDPSGSSNDYVNPPRAAYAPLPPQQEREREQEDDRRRAPSPGYSQGSSYGNYGQTSPREPPRDQGPERPRVSSYDQERAYGGQANSQYRGSVLTYGSPNPNQEEQQEDNWEQLKSYLENQTEAIVHSIQALLSAIRSGAQGEQLNENLTQIITIVSSIVAISKDALPDSSRAEGEEILRDLADNCDKLSGMSQSSSTVVFDKQTKQAMASASFGVAKSLKALNALLDAQPDPMT